GARNRRRVYLGVKVYGTDTAAVGVASKEKSTASPCRSFFPPGDASRQPFPVHRHRRSGPGDGSGPRGRFGPSVRPDRRNPSAHRVHPRRPAAGGAAPPADPSHRAPSHPPGRVDSRGPENSGSGHQYFLDARAVEKDDSLPDGVAARVVPGLCRLGIEAACMEAVRRRRIGRGDAHQAVERELAGAKSTTTLAALALFDDGSLGGKVLGEINKRWGKAAGDAFQDVKAGTHKGFHGNLVSLIDEAQRLAAGLREQ